MKRIRIVGLLGLVMLGLLGCAAQADGSATGGSASASASPGGNGSGNCFHPFPGNSDVRSCVYPNGLYSISYLNVNQYYWHPESGDFTVAETYYRTSAPGRAAGAWPGRTISVGDSCVIDSNWSPNTATPPSNCMDSRTGGSRGATTTEQQSVLKFWQLMTRYVPSSDR